MEDKKDQGSLPAALGRRQRVVSLDGGETVIVEKFSLSKMIYVFEYITGLFKDLPEEELKKLEGNSYMIAARAINLLGDKAPGLIKMLVRKDDQDKVTKDIDADDALEIMVAALDLNLTEKLAKKAAELKALFGRMK